MTVDGGYAEFMRAKASHALPVPDALDTVEAAPLFCAGVTSYRALHNAGVGPGQRGGASSASVASATWRCRSRWPPVPR